MDATDIQRDLTVADEDMGILELRLWARLLAMVPLIGWRFELWANVNICSKRSRLLPLFFYLERFGPETTIEISGDWR